MSTSTAKPSLGNTPPGDRPDEVKISVYMSSKTIQNRSVTGTFTRLRWAAVWFTQNLFVAVEGGLWWGDLCSQTVDSEVFMWIEKTFEGDRAARIRLDEKTSFPVPR